MRQSYPTLPQRGPDNSLQLAAVVRGLMEGKANVGGTLTIPAGQTAVEVQDMRAGGQSIIILMPTTLTSAQLQTWVSSREKGRFTVQCAAAPATAAVFDYVCIG